MDKEHYDQTRYTFVITRTETDEFIFIICIDIDMHMLFAAETLTCRLSLRDIYEMIS